MADENKANPEESLETIKKVEETFLDSKSWLPEFIQPYWEQLQGYPILLAAVVLAVGYLLAKTVQKLFSFITLKVVSKTKNKYDDKLVGVLSKVVFSLIFYISMMFAVDALEFAASTDKLFKRIIMSILVISVMMSALKSSKVLLEILSEKRERFAFIEERTLPILDILSKIILVGAFSYFLILLWGKDPTAWLASAGILGIAVGFAAKDSLANLFSGFFIVADSPYKLGDYVVMDTGERGKVTHVGIRSTRLLTRDDVEITIPNSVMGNTKIVNQSGGPNTKMRVRIPVSVAYNSDLEQVVEVLEKVCDEHQQIAKSPRRRVRARLFAASGIDFELLIWVRNPELRGIVVHQLIIQIHKEFHKLGIEIPYTKQDLYIKKFEDTREPKN